VMKKIAKKLIPAASLTCLLVDDPAEYTRYAEHLFSRELAEKHLQVMIINRENAAIGVLKQKLTECEVNYGEKLVPSFISEKIGALAEEIKREWDQAGVQNYGSLKAQVELLPALLR